MKARLPHIVVLTALALGPINQYALAEEHKEARAKPCIFFLGDIAFSEKAQALFPDSIYADSLPAAVEAPEKIILDPAYYKLYLPITFYDDALMQWLPSKLLRGKYGDAEHNFRVVCEELYNDSLRARAELNKRASKKPQKRQKPAYSSVTKGKKTDANPFQSVVDSLRAAEMQIQFYKLTRQAQKTSKEFYNEWLTEGTPRLKYDTKTFRHFTQSNAFLNSIFYELYYSKPEIIKKWSYKIDTLKVYTVAEEELIKPKVSIAELFRPEPIKAIPRKGMANVRLVKPSFWNFSASSSLQFSQLYVSDNWYKDAEKNLNLQSSFTFKFNYNNQKKIQWDNTLEIKEGFNTTSSDTVRSIHMNNDLLRYTGKIGLQAISNWYYTISTQFTTQLFNGYPTNSDTRSSAFLSPGYLSVGIGMDYKLNKNKLNLSVVLAPLNYDLKFVKDAAIDETQYGIEDGKFALHTYGSKITSTFDWQIFSFVKYTSRFEGFTNYERTEGSWENTLDFYVNRYIKASLFWHIRFDDNVSRDPGESYFQYYELFSFGLTYDW